MSHWTLWHICTVTNWRVVIRVRVSCICDAVCCQKLALAALFASICVLCDCKLGMLLPAVSLVLCITSLCFYVPWLRLFVVCLLVFVSFSTSVWFVKKAVGVVPPEGPKPEVEWSEVHRADNGGGYWVGDSDPPSHQLWGLGSAFCCPGNIYKYMVYYQYITNAKPNIFGRQWGVILNKWGVNPQHPPPRKLNTVSASL